MSKSNNKIQFIKSLATVLAESQANASKISRKKLEKITSLFKGCDDVASLSPFLAVANEEIRREAVTAIGKLDDPQVDAILEQALNDLSSGVRIAVTERCSKRELTEFLLKALQDEDWNVRESAIWGLSYCREPRIIDPLIRVMCDAHEHWRCRTAAVAVLGNHDNPRITELFQAYLDDETVGGDAARQLAESRDTRAYGMLFDALCHGNRSARLVAAISIADCADERALAPYLAMLTESDVEMKREAARGLGFVGKNLRKTIPYPEETAAWIAEEPLCEAFKSNDEDVRDNVVFAIREIGSPRAVELTLEALRDRSLMVKGRARLNLEKLKDKRLVAPLILLLDDAQLRETAINVLGESGDSRAIEPIARFLKDKKYERRIVAAHSLLKLGDRRGWPFLVSAIVDRRGKLTGYYMGMLADTLYEFDEKAAIDFFLEILPSLNSDSDKDLFERVANCLGNSGDVRAIEPLVSFLDNDNNCLQVYAAHALLNLGDQRGWIFLIPALYEFGEGPYMHKRFNILRDMVLHDKSAAIEAILNNILRYNPADKLDEIYFLVAELERDFMELMIDILANSGALRALDVLRKLGECKWVGKKAVEAFEALTKSLDLQAS